MSCLITAVTRPASRKTARKNKLTQKLNEKAKLNGKKLLNVKAPSKERQNAIR